MAEEQKEKEIEEKESLIRTKIDEHVEKAFKKSDKTEADIIKEQENAEAALARVDSPAKKNKDTKRKNQVEKPTEQSLEREQRIVKDLFNKIQDYETIDILKKHKISMHEKILKQAIDTKYKISLSKGM